MCKQRAGESGKGYAGGCDGIYVAVSRIEGKLTCRELAAGPFKSMRKAKAVCAQIGRTNPSARLARFTSI